MKKPEEFATDREYQNYRSRRDGWQDFLMSTGFIVLGLGSMILIMMIGK